MGTVFIISYPPGCGAPVSPINPDGKGDWKIFGDGFGEVAAALLACTALLVSAALFCAEAHDGGNALLDGSPPTYVCPGESPLEDACAAVSPYGAHVADVPPSGLFTTLPSLQQ